MANPSISFTDSSGSATLTNTSPRFASWTPLTHDIGVARVSLGTGLTLQRNYRRDYAASFKVNNIRPKDVNTALRLKLYLENGGSVTVNTNDVSGSSYVCTMQATQQPKFEFTDPKNLEYSLTLFLVNTSGVPLIAQYSSV